MISLIFLSVFLSICTANPPPTYPCCPPREWEATVFDVNSLQSQPYYMQLAHDDAKGRNGIFVYGMGMTKPYSHIVQDYHTRKTYTTILVDPKQPCTWTPFLDTLVTLEDCQNHVVSGVTDLQYHGNSTVGLSPSTIDIDNWFYKMNGKEYFVSLGRNQCFPITEKIKTIEKSADPSQNVDHLLFYSNAKDTVTTPVPVFLNDT